MRYLEDYRPGDRTASGEVEVTEEEIITFASRYDPQPFHLDHAAALASPFGGLAASGWMTMGLTMRLLVESPDPPAWGIIGREVETIGWPRPTRPGDVLRCESEVIAVTPSRSKPDRGMVRLRTDTYNQHGEVVQTMTATFLVPSNVHRSA